VNVKRFLAYSFLVCFLLTSHYLWGLAALYKYPIQIGGANIYLQDLFFLSFALFSFSYVLGKGVKDPRILSLKKPLLLFLFYGIIVIVYSFASGAGFRNIFRGVSQLFYYAIYFGIPFVIRSRKELHFFLLILLTNVLVALFVNLYQNFTGWQPEFVVGPSHFSKTLDMGGIYRTYNPSSQWIVFALCFMYTTILLDKKSLARVSLFAVLAMAMLLTFARNIYIGFLVISVFLALIGFTKRREGLKIANAIWIMMLLFLVLTYVLSSSEAISNRVQTGIFDVTEKQGTFLGRLELFETAQDYLEGRSILLGYGFGSFSGYDPNSDNAPNLLSALESGADSGLVYVLFRLGVVGLVLYAFVHYKFVRISWRRFRDSESTSAKVLYLGGISYTLCLWTQAFASNVFFSEYASITTIIMWAVADVVWHLDSGSSKAKTRTM
jgi:O-antigen ligase